MKKGQTNNPSGRPKGTPNKITADLRMKINAIVEKQIDSIEQDLLSLEPMQRLQIVEKLISYCVPKLQAQTFEIDFQNLSEQQLDVIINQLNFNDDDDDSEAE
mgnify:FL=1